MEMSPDMTAMPKISETTTTASTASSSLQSADEGTDILHGIFVMTMDIQFLGCVVNFQMVDYSARADHFKAPLERNFRAPTAEICATGCYQDGCSGAKYDPATKECSLSYDDKPFCTNGKQVAVARPDGPVWMHCLSCSKLNRIIQLA